MRGTRPTQAELSLARHTLGFWLFYKPHSSPGLRLLGLRGFNVVCTRLNCVAPDTANAIPRIARPVATGIRADPSASVLGNSWDRSHINRMVASATNGGGNRSSRFATGLSEG